MKTKHIILFCLLTTLPGCALRVISAITSGAQVAVEVYKQLDDVEPAPIKPTPAPQDAPIEDTDTEDYGEEA